MHRREHQNGADDREEVVEHDAPLAAEEVEHELGGESAKHTAQHEEARRQSEVEVELLLERALLSFSRGRGVGDKSLISVDGGDFLGLVAR